MDLIHEQKSPLPRLRGDPGLGEYLFEIGDSREHRRQRHEPQAHGVGEQPGDAGLAGSRRPPQDHRAQFAGGDHPADRALRSGQMLLADDFAQALRPKPVGERRRAVSFALRLLRQLLVGEQVGHRPAF